MLEIFLFILGIVIVAAVYGHVNSKKNIEQPGSTKKSLNLLVALFLFVVSVIVFVVYQSTHLFWPIVLSLFLSIRSMYKGESLIAAVLLVLVNFIAMMLILMGGK